MTLPSGTGGPMPTRSEIRRLGFIHPVPDPGSSDYWSGTPAALALAFEESGLDVATIAYRLARPLRGAVVAVSSIRGRGAIARGAALHARVRTGVLARELRSALPLDAVVAVGTDLYDLPSVAPVGVPVATYDDGTFAQFVRHPESDLSSHRYPSAEVAGWLRRQARAARHASACCVSTEWAARSMLEDYGVHAERLHVVGMGHRPRALAAVDRDWSRPRFLFVGADWERKNGGAVVRAFECVLADCPHASLDLVGDHPPVSYPGVHGHGFLRRGDPTAQAELDRLYAEATALVLPSRFDPSPIAYLEAASAGLPVIATSEGGAAELLADAALVVDPHDQRALVDAMLALTDPDRARQRGALGRQIASASSWRAVAGRILDALAGSAAVPQGGPQAAAGSAR